MYLALDIGEKRIGVAVGEVAAFGRGWIAWTNEADFLRTIKTIIDNERVTKIVLGMPRVASGETTPQIARVATFADLLRRETSLPVVTIDETLTSREAEQQLRAEGIDIIHNKGAVDERAAQLILEQYLSESNKGKYV